MMGKICDMAFSKIAKQAGSFTKIVKNTGSPTKIVKPTTSSTKIAKPTTSFPKIEKVKSSLLGKARGGYGDYAYNNIEYNGGAKVEGTAGWENSAKT